MINTSLLPPASLLVAYWMIGSYLMALKRFSEFRQIGEECARLYRRSSWHYSSLSLLNSVVFYAATAMLFLGAFIMRYKLELILAFPLIALLMSMYFNLAFEPDRRYKIPRNYFAN